MTITGIQNTFYEGYISIQNNIQEAFSKRIEKGNQIALPIINALGEMGSYGVTSISHIYKTGVENFSKMVSLINSWINRLFFQAKEAPHLEMEKVILPEEIVVQEIIKAPTLTTSKANIISDMLSSVLQTKELLSQMTPTKAEVQLSVETLLKKTNELILKYLPTESEKEEFLANLKTELHAISDRINFDIDPITQRIEEFIAPKEMVFAQSKLMLVAILEKTKELQQIVSTQTVKMITEFVEEHAPNEEEKAAIFAKIRSERDIVLERIVANAKVSEDFSIEKIYEGNREETLKVLNPVDASNMY